MAKEDKITEKIEKSEKPFDIKELIEIKEKAAKGK